MSKELANFSVEKKSNSPQDAELLSHNAGDSLSESESEQSVASTIQYAAAGHIPFEQFREQVARFLENISDQFVLDIFHIKGGSYNRIVGIRLTQRHKSYDDYFYGGPLSKEYIFRISRGTAAKDLEPHHQQAIYDKVRELIRIPIPRIVFAISNDDNALGRPFTVQERIPGQQLYRLWVHLNHKQKLSIARQIGEYFSQVRHAACAEGGVIRSLSNSCAIFEHSFGNPFDVNDPNGDEAILAQPCSTMDLIGARIQRWQELDVDGIFPWDILFLMLKDADDKHGALKPEKSYYLTHNDFHLRNMLGIIIDDTEVKITGILDWEGAEFAPAIVAFEPPYYLWQSDNEEEDIDDDAARELYYKEPTDDKLKEIKQTFDYYAAQDLGATPDVSFCTYAYHQKAGFVREAWKWVTKGLFDAEDINRLYHVAKHWQKIHKIESGDYPKGKGEGGWVLVNSKDF